MKYLTVLVYFGVLLSFTQVAFCGDEDRLFYDAVRAEASGNLDQAIDYYLKASKISHSANLYGNLANLFFKKEQFGLAILYFRKALLLPGSLRPATAGRPWRHAGDGRAAKGKATNGADDNRRAREASLYSPTKY